MSDRSDVQGVQSTRVPLVTILEHWKRYVGDEKFEEMKADLEQTYKDSDHGFRVMTQEEVEEYENF